MVPSKLTPFTKRTPAVVPLSLSELIMPEFLMSPVNKPDVVASRAPLTRVRSRRIPSPAIVDPAAAFPPPAIVPELVMSIEFPVSLSSADTPAP